jgi:peptide/nickel transport system permease protein
LTLGAYSGSITARLLRSSLIEVLGRDYVRTARAKGLAEPAVIGRHSLKNAALPVVTIIGLQMGQLLSGAIITETVFAYPGMGLLAIQAIRNRDVPVVQAFVIVAAAVVLLVNLIVDLVYVYLDPRVRYAG